jgi:hypothetical protein
MTLRDRHLWGAGAAACAVCCAPPLLALLGIAGAGLAATVATIAFAGLVFGIVIGVATIAAVVIKRRRDTAATKTSVCEPPVSGPVEVSLISRPPTPPEST